MEYHIKNCKIIITIWSIYLPDQVHHHIHHLNPTSITEQQQNNQGKNIRLNIELVTKDFNLTYLTTAKEINGAAFQFSINGLPQ